MSIYPIRSVLYYSAQKLSEAKEKKPGPVLYNLIPRQLIPMTSKLVCS